MTCQECQQRPATLHFKKYTNGQKSEVQLCEVCAKEKGYMIYPDEGYSLHNLLSGLFNFESQQMDAHQGSYHRQQNLQCDHCGLSLAEFKRYGKFGCAKCYESFKSRLDPVLRRVHSGNTKHNGKIPKRRGGHLHTKKELEMYRDELRELVQREEFEKAAIIRDKIKELQQEINRAEAGEGE